MAQAILASAAISALVLPRPVGERIVTDGAWVRNFPLGHAYGQPGVELIVSFRYLPTYPRIGTEALARGGTCTGEHGVGFGKLAYLEQEHPDLMPFYAGIKQLFDPRGIMNPGKVVPA